MGWTLAGNLASRTDSVLAQYPGTTIFAVGDTSHQARPSDHNPDARDIVHALDVMTYSDIDKGNDVLAWCLREPDDLEYVIFNRKIYERDNGFNARSYTGSDPHEDHVHISGKHGSTGYCDQTGTGYDTAAEAMRPEGMEGEDMTPEQGEMLKNINWAVARGAQDPNEDVQAGQAFIYWTDGLNKRLAAVESTLASIAAAVGVSVTSDEAPDATADAT